MSKAFYKIEDFIDTSDADFALTGTSPLDSESTSVTMCSSSDVLNEINDSFGERSIYIKETETPFVSFKALWARWRTRRGDMLAAAWEVLHSEYKPLENYDRIESGSDTKQITPAETTRTITPAETTNTITPAETTNTITPAETTSTITPAETTNTITPAETTKTITPAETTNTITPAETTNTITPAETTTTETITSPGKTSTRSDSVNAFNSNSAVATTGSTVTENGSTTSAITVQHNGTESLDVDTAGSEAITVQHDGKEKIEVDTAGSEAITVQHAGSEAITVQHDGKEKLEVDVSGEEKTTYGHRVRGNIGVTTSQQMAESELALREKDFIYNAICEFIQLYTVYA